MAAAAGPGRWSPTLREIAWELLSYQRVELLDEQRLTFAPPPDFSQMMIISRLMRAVNLAGRGGWECSSGAVPWEFDDGSGFFAIPDMSIARDGADTSAQYQANIVLLCEVTSPLEPGRSFNDRVWKPKWYAAGGVPFYLLVDQVKSSWTLHERREGLSEYQIHSSGHYGEAGDPIDLPEPFGFSIPTDEWPPYTDGEE